MKEARCAIVDMPEGGRYTMRLETPEDAEELAGREVVTLLDYGIDTGRVVSPAPPQAVPPGFAVLRIPSAADLRTRAANETEAAAAAAFMEKNAAGKIAGFRIFSIRLALGRRRFFVRFAAAPARVNRERVAALLRPRWEASVDARQIGPREQAEICGCIGDCGRVCCRASWMKKIRVPGTGHSAKTAAAASFGVCGGRKCCMDFEVLRQKGPDAK